MTAAVLGFWLRRGGLIHKFVMLLRWICGPRSEPRDYPGAATRRRGGRGSGHARRSSHRSGNQLALLRFLIGPASLKRLFTAYSVRSCQCSHMISNEACPLSDYINETWLWQSGWPSKYFLALSNTPRQCFCSFRDVCVEISLTKTITIILSGLLFIRSFITCKLLSSVSFRFTHSWPFIFAKWMNLFFVL